MSFIIHQNEGIAARRRIPLWLVQSNGTTPAQFEAGTPAFSVNGSALTAVAAGAAASIATAQGRYYAQLSQSEVSVPGNAIITYSSATCFEQGAQFVISAVDPFDNYMPSNSDRTTRGGSASVATLSSLETTRNDIFNGAFFVAQYASGEYVGNIISDYNGSDKSVAFKNAFPVALGSGVTYWIFPGTAETDLSAQTVGSVLTVIASGSAFSAPPKPGTYSDVTVQINNIAAGAYSGVTVGINNIGAGTFSGVTVGVNNISGSNITQFASWLSYNLGNARIPQEAIFALRNKVDATGGSVMTVYKTDDSTSAWTASVSTSANAISAIDPL